MKQQVRDLPPIRPIEFARPQPVGIAPLALTITATLTTLIFLCIAVSTAAVKVMPADGHPLPIIFVGKAIGE